MAGKLHPPYIDGKVPAFCGTVLKVPFRQNRAVSISDIDGFVCKLKTVSTNEWVWTIKAISWEPMSEENGYNYVLFDLSQTYNERRYTGPNQVDINEEGYTPYYQWLIIGLYYKIQLAYIKKGGEIGYFSDVGVTKYTSTPAIYIEGLDIQSTNNSKYEYVGVYNQSGGDVSEKEYYYNFTIYDEKDNIFLTTGTQTHNSSLDESNEWSSDVFHCNKELQANTRYKLEYKVTTNNNLVCSSGLYRLIKKDTVKSPLNASLEVESDFDNGFISLSLVPNDEKYYSGTFAVARSSSKDNFQTWNEIYRFSLNRETPLVNLFKDFTIEQGVQYKYSIQQYNSKGLYSTRIQSKIIEADFEDMFLYDGERQLNIRFNPGITSFKSNILEAKQDTIGSQYAFIFRNQKVYYKEFPITGLISYLSDNQEFFMRKSDLGHLEVDTTDLISDNVRAERLFKLEVMKWLENGKPKLFRSPTEGNYLVRLMQNTLAPVAGLGRMLHTFSCMAYEIDNTEFETLNSYGMFKDIPKLETRIMKFKEIFLSGLYTIDENNQTIEIQPPVHPYDNANHDFSQETPPSITTIKDNIVNIDGVPNINETAYIVRFEGCRPGTLFGIQFEVNGDSVIEYIEIGKTMVYEVNSERNGIVKIYPVWTPNATQTLEEDRVFDGSITYGYYSSVVMDNFSEIADFNIRDTLQQWYGKHDNIINEIEDICTSTGRFYWMKFTVRNTVDFWINSEGRMFSASGDGAPELPFKEIIPTQVYINRSVSPPRYFSGDDIIANSLRYAPNNDNSTAYATIAGIMDDTSDNKVWWTADTLDPWYEGGVPVDRQYKIAIGHHDDNIDLRTIKRYIITDIDSISLLSIGRMILLDCYYQICETIYSVEDENEELANLRRTYEAAKETFWEMATSEEVPNPEPDQEEIDTAWSGVKTAYENFYNKLCEVLNNQIEEG